MSAFRRCRASRTRRDSSSSVRLAEARDAPPGSSAVFRIDLESDITPAVPERRDSGGAASHERIERRSFRRTARQHHALDDFERLLRRMLLALRVLPVNPRYAPDVLGVAADFEPFLADEDRARARALDLRRQEKARSRLQPQGRLERN